MERVDIRNYPLTYRLCQVLYKNEASKKAIDIVFSAKIPQELSKNYKLSDKYKENKYLNLLKELGNKRNTILTSRKTAYVPNNNANFIEINGVNAKYYSYNYIKKNASKIEKYLIDVIDGQLFYMFLHRFDRSLLRNIFKDTYPRTYGGFSSSDIQKVFIPLSQRCRLTDKHVVLTYKNKEIIIAPNKYYDSPGYKNLRLHILSSLIKTRDHSSRRSVNFVNMFDGYIGDILPKEECKAGKVFNKVFDQIKSNEIEEILNCYIGVIKLSASNLKQVVELTGDEITEFYSKYKYHGYSDMSGGTLNNSCMKYVICRDRFGIYEKNPNIIKMIVIFDKNFKSIEARALLWDNKYLDRIYYNKESAKRLIRSYAVSKKYINVNSQNGAIEQKGLITVQLNEWRFNYYPYLDTFHTIDQTSGEIYANVHYDNPFNPDPINVGKSPLEGKPLINCRNYSQAIANDCSISQKATANLTIYSSDEGKEIPITDAVYSNILSCFLNKEKAIYINGLDDFDHYKNHSKYDYCIKINSDSDKDNILFNSGLYPLSESIFIEELSCRVHISCLNFNEETCEFEVKYPENSSK